jgi:phosphoserine aminotransferase
MAKIKAVGESDHYNSMTLVSSMMDKWQTSCTPNVLAIYLLMRILKDSDPIAIVDSKIKSRFQAWSLLLRDHKSLAPLVANDAARSYTVLTIALKEGDLSAMKTRAKRAGFLLGEGYGALKKDTFRIANFPAIRRKEIQNLMRFFIRHA